MNSRILLTLAFFLFTNFVFGQSNNEFESIEMEITSAESLIQ